MAQRRPPARLADADTSAVRHTLLVKIVADGDPDKNSRGATLRVLQFVCDRKEILGRMGISVEVVKIRSGDLRNPRVVGSLRSRGVARLPALLTPGDVYLGVAEIEGVYDRNIKEFHAFARREERPVGDIAEEDELAAMYREEMTQQRAAEESEEPGIGQADDMLKAYHTMIKQREARLGPSRPRAPGGAGALGPAGSARPAGARPDNVATRRPAASPEDDEIEATIDRLARGIGDSTVSKAFSSSGGDSYEGDAGTNAQDDLIEAAYWAARSETERV